MSNVPSKKLKDICTELDEPYIIKVIDKENVLYRDLGNGFEFEISGLDNQKSSFNAIIYVWQIEKYQRRLETISDIKSLDELKSHLDATATKYLNLSISDFDTI